MSSDSTKTGETLAQTLAQTQETQGSYGFIHLAMGTQVGPYDLLDQLGRGAMGEVWRARHVTLQRTVALKMIRSGSLDPGVVARFQAEAEISAELDHPGIVPIYEAGDVSGTPYLAMKLVEGGSLADHLTRIRSDRNTAVRIVIQIARAVHYAHQRGVLHRDLKPANILMDEKSQQPMITDFGLAKRLSSAPQLSVSGSIIGTPSYMAPEQAAARKDISTAADIYSLGAILYEVLTGRPPFGGDSVLEVLKKVTEEQPVSLVELDPSIDPTLELICLKCLEKSPSNRYASAMALADDLERFLAGEHVSIRPPSFGTIISIWARQNFGSLGWAAVGGVACGLVVGSYTLLEAVGGKLTRLSSAYQLLPSEPKPFLARDPLPQWILATAEAGMYLVLPVILLATSMLVRSRNRSADLASGILTGITTAIVFYTIAFGWWTTYSMSTLPMVDELRLITGPPEELLQRYPDLAHLPEKDHRELLLRKLEFDQATRMPGAVILGMLLSLIVTLPVCVSLLLLGGSIVRKHGIGIDSTITFLELALSGLVFFGHAFLLFQRAVLYGDRPQHPWCYITMLLTTAASLTLSYLGVPRGLRACFCAGWFAFYLYTNALRMYEF